MYIYVNVCIYTYIGICVYMCICIYIAQEGIAQKMQMLRYMYAYLCEYMDIWIC
jgi:hypothetical protein